MSLSNIVNDQFFFDGQVLEYQSAGSKWNTVGDLQKPRADHTVVTIGTQPCIAGETFKGR